MAEPDFSVSSDNFTFRFFITDIDDIDNISTPMVAIYEKADDRLFSCVGMTELTNAAEVLDLVSLYAKDKRWSDADVGTYIRLLNSVLYFQKNYCPFGKFKQLKKENINKMVEDNILERLWTKIPEDPRELLFYGNGKIPSAQ